MSNWRERLKAATHGEVSRASIDPYRAAGAGVYEYVLELDSVRAEGGSLPQIQAVLLAGWIAFALQVLGDEMLDADAAVDPSTANFVPPVTARQVMAFYEPVQSWMARAQAARANPSYRIDVPLPEVLPEWVEVEPCPRAHLLALRQAVGRLKEQGEALMVGFDPNGDDGHAKAMIAQGLAEAESAATYANGLWSGAGGAPHVQIHEDIESNLKAAAETYFYLGQVIAMPPLADVPRPVRGTDDEKRESFMESMIGSYPQISERRGNGMLSGLAGGFLGGLIGSEIANEIFGGDGLGDDGGGWADGDWDGG